MDAAARTAQRANGDTGAMDQPGAGEHAQTGLQQGFLAAAHELARRGHPAGTP